MQRINTHKTLGKGLELLLAFVPHNKEMGTVELSKKLGFHTSTASRLLHVLVNYGFVQQDPQSKKFMLGKAASDLGRTVNKSLNTNLVTIAKPYIDELSRTISETAGFEIMVGNSTILTYMADGPRAVRVSVEVGGRLPLHVASGAKAILAHSPPEIFDSLIKGRLKRFTPNTITNRKILRQKLDEIRQQGVAFDHGELDIDVHTMAAPVFNHDQRAVAAVVIAAPDYRWKSHPESHFVSLLKETAAKISARLHYSGAEIK